jgi:hypothetical protein
MYHVSVLPLQLFFVLDYCAGGELFFHLGKLGKFPEPRAKASDTAYTIIVMFACKQKNSAGSF